MKTCPCCHNEILDDAIYCDYCGKELTKKEENIIHSHMRPLTLRAIPKSKEAFIICLVDKWCAIIESKEHYMEKIKSKKIKNVNSYK